MHLPYIATHLNSTMDPKFAIVVGFLSCEEKSM